MPGEAFEELVAIMARLRAPGGCPWDREQTLKDLGRYLREEADETAKAIEEGDLAHVCEELGDLLFNVIHAARIAEEQGAFDIGRVVEGARTKIIRRHPHVFGDAKATTTEEVLAHWERVKAEERRAKGS
jgi:tetrapyrrole methylase family protein/MazG family protein